MSFKDFSILSSGGCKNHRFVKTHDTHMFCRISCTKSLQSVQTVYNKATEPQITVKTVNVTFIFS